MAQDLLRILLRRHFGHCGTICDGAYGVDAALMSLELHWSCLNAATMLMWGVPDGGKARLGCEGTGSAVGVGDAGAWHRAARFTGLGTRLGAFGLLR